MPARTRHWWDVFTAWESWEGPYLPAYGLPSCAETYSATWHAPQNLQTLKTCFWAGAETCLSHGNGVLLSSRPLTNSLVRANSDLPSASPYTKTSRTFKSVKTQFFVSAPNSLTYNISSLPFRSTTAPLFPIYCPVNVWMPHLFVTHLHLVISSPVHWGLGGRVCVCVRENQLRIETRALSHLSTPLGSTKGHLASAVWRYLLHGTEASVILWIKGCVRDSPPTSISRTATVHSSRCSCRREI